MYYLCTVATKGQKKVLQTEPKDERTKKQNLRLI